MLRFEGDRDFPLPPDALFARLTDARFLVACLPDVEQVKEQEPDRALFTVRPGLAFARGTLEVTLRVVEKAPPSFARMAATSKGVGSSSTVEASWALTPTESGTRMTWVAEVKELGGLLKMVPQGLIRGAAQKVINDAWAAVEAKLRETA
jgi:carbon monoxide dehydrogenase subunit G